MVSRSDNKMRSFLHLSNAVCSFSFASISINDTYSGFLSLFHRQESTQFFVHISPRNSLGSGSVNAHLLISSTV